MTIDPGSLDFGQKKPAPAKPAKKTKVSTTKISKPGSVADTIISTPEKFGLPDEPKPIAPEPEKTFDVFAPSSGNLPITTPSGFGMAPDLPASSFAGNANAGMDTIPGAGSSITTTGKPAQNNISLERQDAFQFVINALKPYGLDGVGAVLNDLMQDPTIGPAKAEYIIKYDTTINPKTGKPFNEAYAKRFAGNFKRIEQGLPAYSEGEYMAYENQYKSLLNSVGYGNLATKSNMETWIAGTVSPSEIASRVELATALTVPVQQILKGYLPSISNNDIVGALLDTTNGLPVLKQKIEKAKIGAAASAAGFAPLTESRAEQLLQGNISEVQAQRGYMDIASGIDRGRQLTSMQGGGDISLTEAENVVFGLPGSKEAEKKFKKTASQERALYQRSSGLTAGALDTGRAGAI